MAQGAVLHRWVLELDHRPRALERRIEMRVARHPSESAEHLVARLVAFALFFDDELAFSSGLSAGDQPALGRKDPGGRWLEWIDIGRPAGDRLHRAAKTAEQVRVVLFQPPKVVAPLWRKVKVHRAGEIEIVALDPRAVGSIAQRIERSIEWRVRVEAERASVALGRETFESTLEASRLSHWIDGV